MAVIDLRPTLKKKDLESSPFPLVFFIIHSFHFYLFTFFSPKQVFSHKKFGQLPKCRWFGGFISSCVIEDVERRCIGQSKIDKGVRCCHLWFSPSSTAETSFRFPRSGRRIAAPITASRRTGLGGAPGGTST